MLRYVPEDATKFVSVRGPLRTTQANADFFVKHPNFDFDSSKMRRLVGSDIKRFSAEYGLVVAYSPRHIAHPHDLTFFDPRGHSRMLVLRDKYEKKLNEDSLWIIFTGGGVDSPIVRTMTLRRMKSALYAALLARGFERTGKAKDREIRGTVWVYFQFPPKAAEKSPERFGAFMAKMLDEQFGRPVKPAQ